MGNGYWWTFYKIDNLGCWKNISTRDAVCFSYMHVPLYEDENIYFSETNCLNIIFFFI